MNSKKLGRYKAGAQVILSNLLRNKKEIVFLSLISLVVAALNSLTPLITGKLIDGIIANYHIIFWLYIWFFTQLALYLIDFLKRSRSQVLGRNLYVDYIVNAYNKFLLAPLSFHKKQSIHPVLNSVQRSAGSLETIGSETIIGLLPEFVTIIFALIISSLINWQLTLCMLAGIVVYIFILYKMVTPSAQLQEISISSWMKAWRLSHDAITNVIAVKQMVMEKIEGSKTARRFKTALNNQLKLFVLNRKLSLWQNLIVLITRAVVFSYSIVLILNKEMSVGELIAFNSYAGMLFGPFLTLGNSWRFVQNGLISLEETEKHLKIENENYNPINGVKIKDFQGRIEFKDVNFSYHSKQKILQGINFTVLPNQVIALVGESGVGKSTLIDLISAYYFPTKGKVLIDNHDLKTLDLPSWRSQIAVVSQEVVLFNDTIENNLKYGSPKTTRAQIEIIAKKAHALDFIEKFPKKWNQMVGDRGIKLSVGQKQRVAIARALLRDPKILILDEPTSALDAASEKVIQESLEELMKGRTTFIIAHRLSTVRRADKILVFKDGQIAEMGKHEELIQKEGGVYRHLYELQIGLHQ